MTVIARTARWEHPERNFFLAFFVIGAIGVIFGFVPPSWTRWTGRANYPAPLQLQIHAGLFLGWVVVVGAQIGFIRQGERAWHRRLGLLGATMVPLMVAFGLLAEVYAERFYMVREPGSERFFIVPLFSMVLFPLFTGLGIAWRRRPDVHKRLIYMGTMVLFGAAWSRVVGHGLPDSFADSPLRIYVQYFLADTVFLAALMAFDWSRARTVHPVTLLGAAVVIPAILVSCSVYYTGWWLRTADSLLAAFPA